MRQRINWYIFIGIIIAFTAVLWLVRIDNEEKIRETLVTDWHKYYVMREHNLAYVNATPKKKYQKVLSEGQGYGMEIAAMNPNGDKATFDRLYRYYLDNREMGSELMSWRQIKRDGSGIMTIIALLMGMCLSPIA
ncbi:glycosyl hydrolase family 8 [Lactobacillus gigeriorum]|uniref:Glycoside hydrolase, family 8 n=1 Tax=Lactobacillus gigeriorum DSM 23908 = CRBIP 24.85 TaxID=1423751 RepID=I7K0A5_9LACO|nr:glycosyl hydrolase family 8 [Lactobacillus gigeriorum]KRN13792.1 hypothetical protein FC38_GL001846 [Lactobacillus gigeriorum DSM 23908 = CRBIP 24.85]CCI86760.1 Glycoside hydrolase, family 8 [Lactobacillus gigeriorum DSM 23908 = CRBIP 24.85]